MKINITLSIILYLISLSTRAQHHNSWKFGKYFDESGNSVEGLISYGYSQNPKFKFKENDSSKEMKIKASEVKGFVVEKDSFIVIHNFKIDSRTSVTSGIIPVDFVQVIESGDLTLYKHYSSVYVGGDSYSSIHGSSSGAGSSNLIETFIIRESNTGVLWTIYSEPKKLRAQLLDIFQHDPVLLFRVSQEDLNYSDLPDLVKKYNERYI
ncbi:hypothetical protein [Reichenbachiella sp. MALMAid0571]|uniref:hypothetical protein n=1 Tax=Reichenbachiella sp. MALMAid0571 TaxID=3143939 RepID=UPI0032DEDE49